MSNKLNELLVLCSKNKIEFIYQKEGDNNYVEYSDNPHRCIINVVNVNDENLDELLSENIKKLNQLFK